MSNELQIFQNEEFGSVRTVIKDEEIWFIAKDVCECLEVKNVSDALSRLDEDEKGIVLTDTLGGKQEMTCVNESGLYSLVLSSRKPEAKKFKKWVTSEVLPSIRKHGAYLTPKTTEELIANPDLIIELAMQLKNERLAKQQAELKLQEAKPKIEYYEKVLDSVSEFTTTQVAKELCMTAKQLNKILANEGIQFKQNGQWLLYAEYNDKGYTKTRTSTYEDSKGNTQTKWLTVWTEAGREFLHELVESL